MRIGRLAWAFVLAAGFVVGGAAGAEKERLPTVGTAGMAAAKIEGTVIPLQVGREGDFRVGSGADAVAVPAESATALAIELEKRAGADRDEASPGKTSRATLVVRADPYAIWGRVATVLACAASADVRLSRVVFAVRVAGSEEEGTLALFLPVAGADGGKEPKHLAVAIAPASGRAPAVGPAPVHSMLSKLAGDGRTVALLEADPEVSVGRVLQLVETALASGFTRIALADRKVGGATPGNVWTKATVSVFGNTLRPSEEKPPAGAGRKEGLYGVLEPVAVPGALAIGGAKAATPEEEEPAETPAASAAIAAGLDWLAAHQDAEGLWDADGFASHCGDDPCGGAGYSLYDPGVTGLALLAFLGDGNTHKDGPYKRVVLATLKYLHAIQDPEGCFGPRTTNHFTYNHAIATLAMAEAYGRSESDLLRQPTQAGVDFVLKAQNPYLAWRYGVRPQDNDTSVSAWMVAALAAAQAAGIRIPPEAFPGARSWLDKVTDAKTGRVGYMSPGSRPARPLDLVKKFPEEMSEAPTAAAIAMRVLMGEAPELRGTLGKSVDLLMALPPKWDEKSGRIDLYYWYYGTEALSLVGGPTFGKWNRALVPALTDHQRTSGHAKGSWDPVGIWGSEGGRVYSTALAVLALETPHRLEWMTGK